MRLAPSSNVVRKLAQDLRQEVNCDGRCPHECVLLKTLDQRRIEPRFVVTHMNTLLEAEIQEELYILSKSLDVSITLAHEELVIEL